MKNLIIFGFFILSLVFVQFAQAQTVDDVVDKYIAAMGGKEKLMSLNSVKMEGSMNVQGYDVSITTTRLHMKGMRSDIVVAGVDNYQIITPEKGIIFMPIQGMSTPTDMTDEQLKAGQLQLDVQSSLLNYKEKGTTVELLGSEMIDGVDNYKLKLTYKNGIVSTYFIGKNDYRLNKTSSKRNINGTDTDVESTFSNYKQNAGGYWFAYNSSSMQGEMVYDKIETNIPVDENIFK
ncbi:MAG: hypothetical protein WAR78_09475 [Ferruginibacter sp.]